MNKYIERVIKHINKFPITDRYDIVRIYGIEKEEYLHLLEYEKSLIDKTLLGNVYSTLDIPATGTYDFQFEVQTVQVVDMYSKKLGHYSGFDPDSFREGIKNNFLLDTPLRIYIDIFPGGLVDIDGDTYDVNLDLINNSDWGWEVETEISEIFYEFINLKIPLIKNSCADEIFELYPNYPD
jgi:hypothetical protein